MGGGLPSLRGWGGGVAYLVLGGGGGVLGLPSLRGGGGLPSLRGWGGGLPSLRGWGAYLVLGGGGLT